MAFQDGWQPSWTCTVEERRGDKKPIRVNFGFVEDEPVAQPARGADLGLPVMTIDEFNRQYKDFPAALEAVRLAFGRARNQKMKLPKVFRASELLEKA